MNESVSLIESVPQWVNIVLQLSMCAAILAITGAILVVIIFSIKSDR